MSCKAENRDWTSKDACRRLERGDTIIKGDRIWCICAKEHISHEDALAMNIEEYREWRERAFDGVAPMWHPVFPSMIGKKTYEVPDIGFLGRPREYCECGKEQR